MRTEDLVRVLAADVSPVDSRRVKHRSLSVFVGAIVGLILVTLAWLGPRPDLAAAAGDPMFWIKLAFPATVAVSSGVVLERLGHPGVRLRVLPWMTAAAFGLVWAGAAVVLISAAPIQRGPLVLGGTAPQCVMLIAALSFPAMLAAFWLQRRLAPTRPRLTGAFAGLFAGGCAAFAYALHCTEMQLPFLGIWYALGMLIPASAGALAGSRLLRW